MTNTLRAAVILHYPVEQAETALRQAMTEECMKVVIAGDEYL